MMKILPLLISWSLLPLLLSSQINNVDLNLSGYLKCGESYYSADYQGIKSLMRDLQNSDYDTYGELLPIFQEFERKRNIAVYAGSSSLLAGTALIAVGFTKLYESRSTDFDNHEFNTVSESSGGGGIAAAGGAFIIAGMSIVAIFLPGESDYYNIINAYNRKSKKNKMEWKVGISPFAGNGLGLSLKINI